MYTLSLRPNIEGIVTNLCCNFEQESCEWKLSTYTESTYEALNIDETNLGLQLYTPLESLDITSKQVASMLAGLESAYKMLADAVYEEAPKIVAKTPFRTLEMFMSCIPRGLFQKGSPVQSENTLTYGTGWPILVAPGAERYCFYDERNWIESALEGDLDGYENAGIFYGWDVLYLEQNLISKEPLKLVSVMSRALDCFADQDSDSKLYTANLNAVR